MTTQNKITLTRRKIDEAIDELAVMICMNEGSHEIDLNGETTCYMEERRLKQDGYRAIEILSVVVEHDSPRALRRLTNLAAYIAECLDAKVALINADEYRYAREWEYQMEFESVGGLYMY